MKESTFGWMKTPCSQVKTGVRQLKELSANVVIFIAIVSNNSVSKKGYVQKELKVAFDILDQYPANQIYVIPIRVEDCAIDDRRLNEIHYVDFFPDFEFGLSKVLRAIRQTSPDKTEPKLASAEAHETEPQHTYADSKASSDQVESAKQFFEGVKLRKEAIRQRNQEKADARLVRSNQIRSLITKVDEEIAPIVAAFNDAAGQQLLNLQISEFPANVFEDLGRYRILISFGTRAYWLVRFVTYDDGTLALQLVKVIGEPNAKVSDVFNLTNDSINLVFGSQEFWVSLNSRISDDVASEVVRDIPRANRPLEQLPGTMISLLRNCIELELVRATE